MKTESLNSIENGFATTAASGDETPDIRAKNEDVKLAHGDIFTPVSRGLRVQSQSDSLHTWPTSHTALRGLIIPHFPTRQEVVPVPSMTSCPSLWEEGQQDHQFGCNDIAQHQYESAIRSLERAARHAGGVDAVYDLAGATLCHESSSPRQRREACVNAIKSLESSIISAREQENNLSLPVLQEKYEYCLNAAVWAWEEEVAQSSDATERGKHTKALHDYRADLEDWHGMIKFKKALNDIPTLRLGNVLKYCSPMSLALVEDLNLTDKSLQHEDMLILLKALNESIKVVDVLPLKRLNLARNKLGNCGIEALGTWICQNVSKLPKLVLVEVANNGVDEPTEKKFAGDVLGSCKRLAVDGQFGPHTEALRLGLAKRRVGARALARIELAPWIFFEDESSFPS